MENHRKSGKTSQDEWKYIIVVVPVKAEVSTATLY
jgi:hypothetical protein